MATGMFQAQKSGPSADAQQKDVRIRAMMESGGLVDEMAQEVSTQLIVHGARASIRNRAPVPLYHVVGERRQPAWQENLVVETGESPNPTADSRYCLEDSFNLHKGIRNGSVQLRGDGMLQSRAVAIAANVAALVAMIALLWFASLSFDPGPETPPDTQGEVQNEMVDPASGEAAGPDETVGPGTAEAESDARAAGDGEGPR